MTRVVIANRTPPEVRARVIEAIKAGRTYAAAAQFAGTSATTARTIAIHEGLRAGITTAQYRTLKTHTPPANHDMAGKIANARWGAKLGARY